MTKARPIDFTTLVLPAVARADDRVIGYQAAEMMIDRVQIVQPLYLAGQYWIWRSDG